MPDDRLTDEQYWTNGYRAQPPAAPLDVRDWRFLAERRFVELVESAGGTEGRVLEIGAGNSAVLSHLAAKHRITATFTGLDYSDVGCRLLAERAVREQSDPVFRGVLRDAGA